jgi:hypothetical protein
MLAGIGTGALASARAAADAWCAAAAATGRQRVRHIPDPRAHDRLREALARRRALYGAVRSVGAARGLGDGARG